MFHPVASTHFVTTQLTLHGISISWSKTARYLEVPFDTRLSYRSAVNIIRNNGRKVLIAARHLLARGWGCTPTRAMCIYNAVASARALYSASVLSLSHIQWNLLDTDYRKAIREYYSLPVHTQVGPIIAETPLSLRAAKQALNHVLPLNGSSQGQ
ncbi:hypothetical protein MRX96_019308 [Rhipicephalus microplus]